jgi:hypothetical protein
MRRFAGFEKEYYLGNFPLSRKVTKDQGSVEQLCEERKQVTLRIIENPKFLRYFKHDFVSISGPNEEFRTPRRL